MPPARLKPIYSDNARWRPTETTTLASFTRLVGPNVLLITNGVELAECGISSAANANVATPKSPNRCLRWCVDTIERLLIKADKAASLIIKRLP